MKRPKPLRKSNVPVTDKGMIMAYAQLGLILSGYPPTTPEGINTMSEALEAITNLMEVHYNKLSPEDKAKFDNATAQSDGFNANDAKASVH